MARPRPSIARRASVLMIILGVLGIIGAGIIALVSSGLAAAARDPREAVQVNKLLEQTHLSLPDLQWTFMMIAGATAVVGIYHVGMALFVRTGRRPALITAMVINGVFLGFFALSSVASLLNAPETAVNIFGCGIVALPLPLLLMVWLIQALRMPGGADVPAPAWAPTAGAFLPPPPPGDSGWGYDLPVAPPPPPPPSSTPPAPPSPSADQGE